MPTRIPRRALTALLVAAVCLPLGAHPAPRMGLPDRVEPLLADATLPGPRLSVASPPGQTLLRPAAGARTRARVLREIRARLAGGADAEALHAAALLDMAWTDKAGVAAARAVAQMQSSVDAGGPTPARLSDLAAAYLVRGQHGGGFLDVHNGLEAAARALDLDSLHPPARHNLALALETLMLDSAAATAWARYRELEPRPEWRAVAERRLAARSPPAAPWRIGGRPLARAAAAAPQDARVFAVDTVLGEWGRALLAGDTAAAAARLAVADTIGRALAHRGGDGTVAAMTGTIRRYARQPGELRRLADAHAAYARAQQRLAGGDAAQALAGFERAGALAATHPSLSAWAAYGRVLALFYSGRAAEASRACAALAESVDAGRLPVLAARIQWSMGTLALRGGSYPAAQRRYEAAARLFQQAGERENLGRVQALRTEALLGMGDTRAAYASLPAALQALRAHRGSTGLHNLLHAAANAAAMRGLSRAALYLHDEDVAVASRLESGVHAEALLLRARTRAAREDTAGARRDVEQSAALVAAVPEDFRVWLGEDLLVARAQLAIRRDPLVAVARLDTAVQGIQARGSRTRLVTALVHRADARLRAGDPAGSVADLERAAAHRDSLQSDVQSAAVRVSMAESGRRVFDRMALLHARAGRPRQALAALERGRAVFGPARGRTASSAPPAAPPGEIVLDYALVGDTLLAFAVRGRSVHLARMHVQRTALLAELDHLRAALELRAEGESLRPRLSALHALLVRPLLAHVPASAPLVIVADGEIAAAPFAALWDAKSGRYLVQDHRLRFVPTLAEAAAPSRPTRTTTGRAVFVADPAFHPQAYPALQRLARTGAGVRRLAAGYPRASVLANSEAERDRVVAALGEATLFHFAGHAVFDPDRPADSYLVLAGEPPRGRLTASELEAMDLHGLRLVVLSACETQRSASGRSGGFAGLSGALLAAGAGGVVGSTWRVDDDHTRALMDVFHPAYRGSGEPADALRQAQLRMLASRDPALRSPSAWAGFRYAGS